MVRWTIQFSSCFIPYFPHLFSVRSFSFQDCYCLLFPCRLLTFFFMCPQRKQLLTSLFIRSKYLTGMARYDLYAQALEDNSFDCVVLFVMTSPCPPFTLKCNTWEGTSVFTQTFMAHCGSNVTNATHVLHLKCAT